MAVGNMHKNLVKFGRVDFERCDCEQTGILTNGQADILITVLRGELAINIAKNHHDFLLRDKNRFERPRNVEYAVCANQLVT